MAAILLLSSAASMQSDKKNSNLKLKLNEVASYISVRDTINLEVSEASVAWHMDHIYLMVNQLHKALKCSDESNYKAESNKTRDYVFTSNTLPRGKVTAPQSVRPAENITINMLQMHYDEALATVEKLPMLAEKKHFNHPILGTMNRDETIKFLTIHTEHHLKIIRDILKNKENKKITAGKSEVVENDKTQRLDSVYSAHFERNEFNGNVLVAEKGEIIFQKSYGIANEETNEKLNVQTSFELASVSKQFTAMGIVQLQKDGKLSYSDLISKYIPELKYYENVTIKNLLIHTGGLTDYMGIMEENWDKSKIATNEDVIKIFAKLKPKKEFEPNQKYSYSNTGYLILGTIIERVSGKSFEDYLKEKIFEPLEMDNSFVYRRRYNPKKINNYALGYIYSDSLKRNIVPDESPEDSKVIYLDGIVGDGMVNSNLIDLYKWDRALYGNELVNNEDKKLIFSSYPTENKEETGYGFGWFVRNDSLYGKRVLHTGRWAGYLTIIERHIDTDKTIIQLINIENKITTSPAKFARKILYNQPIEKTFTLPEEVLKKYVGTYIWDGRESEITFEFGRLWDSGQFELKPISETEFIVIGYRPEVTFKFNIDNEEVVNGYRVQQKETGLDRTYVRKK